MTADLEMKGAAPVKTPSTSGGSGRSWTRTSDRSEITGYSPGLTNSGLTGGEPVGGLTGFHPDSPVISDGKVTADLGRVNILNWRVLTLGVAAWFVAIAVIVGVAAVLSAVMS